MQQKSTYVRELFSITKAVAKFRHYLLRHPFIIRTDQQSLKHLTDQVIQTPEQEAWLPKLLGFQYSIEYKSGSCNQAADGLSRSFYMAFSIPHCSFLDDIKQAVVTSSSLQSLIEQYHSDPFKFPLHTIRNGLLY